MISIRGFLFLTIGLLFCILGCTRDRADVLIPDHIPPSTEVHETFNAEMSFEQNVLPILTAKCALAGCHVADGPHGLDFRTYESFIAGGEHGPAFLPGNADESEIVEEIVEGKMPPPASGLPTLSAAELQILKDWINQQEAHGDTVAHDEGHDAHDDMDGDHDDGEAHDDMDDDHEMGEAHEDMDDDHEMGEAHEDMDDHGDEGDAHDDDDGHAEMNDEHDNGDNGHDDN